MAFMFSDELPDPSQWQRLAEQQSATPASFVDGPPVLHGSCANCDAVMDSEPLQADAQLNYWFKAGDSSPAVNGDAEQRSSQKVTKQDVDIYITTEALILVSNKDTNGTHKTVKIPYPAISLHATQRLYVDSTTGSSVYSSSQSTGKLVSALYFQLDPLVDQRDQSNPNVEDIDGNLDLLIVPPAQSSETSNGTNGTTDTDANASGLSQSSAGHTAPNQSIVNELFAALNACADLWPDEEDDDDDNAGNIPVLGGMEDDATPAPMPGSGGWITSDNAHEFEGVYADVEEETGEDGVVRILGPGAGTRRGREAKADEGEQEDHEPPNGDSDETKWQRTG